MRHQKIALASAALFAVVLSGACTRGGGGGGEPPLKDCGTVDSTAPVTAEENAAINCWNGYHFGYRANKYKIVSVNGAVSTTYETMNGQHQIKATTRQADGTTTTRTCTSSQVTGQVTFNLLTGAASLSFC